MLNRFQRDFPLFPLFTQRQLWGSWQIRENGKCATSAEICGPLPGTDPHDSAHGGEHGNQLPGSQCWVQRDALQLLEQCCCVSQGARCAGAGGGCSERHSRAGYHWVDLCISQEELSSVTPCWGYLSPGMCVRNSYAAAAAFSRAEPRVRCAREGSEQEW